MEGEEGGGTESRARLADAAKEAMRDGLVSEGVGGGGGGWGVVCGGWVGGTLTPFCRGWPSTASCALCALLTSLPPHSHTRFNLLREEGEGYAKLLTLLNQQGGGKLEMDRVPAAVRGGGGGGGGTSVQCGDPAMGMGGYFS